MINKIITTLIVFVLFGIALWTIWVKEVKVLNDWRFWTFLIGVISICGGIPGIYSFFQHSEIKGKIISRYGSLNENQTMFIFKLSLYSKNKPFNIKQIKCQIEDLEGNKLTSIAENARIICFTMQKPDKLNASGKMQYVDVPQILLVDGNDFLNNYSFIPKNNNIAGYLYFKFNNKFDGKIKSTIFSFESFDDKIQQLEFQESKIESGMLLHDDTIWRDLTDEEKQSFLQN